VSKPRPGLVPPRTDLLLALVLTAVTQAELWTNDGVKDPFAVQVAAFALITVAVAWRRAAPLAAAVALSTGFAVQVIAAGDAPVVGGLVGALIVTYAAGAYGTDRQAALAGAALVLGLVAAAFWDADKRGAGDAIGTLLIFGVVLALGRAMRLRRGEARQLGAEVAEQRRRSAEVLAQERSRIARELHDVIAHNVSLMVLQAGAARQVLDDDPERVREPLLTIEATGRQAIAEMRRLLGILRSDEDPAGHEPQPGLDRLDELVEQTGRAGLAVELHRSGAVRPLPAGVDLAAFRIVQEALTNALKHAGPASTRVDVRYGPRDVELEIADDGRGPVARNGSGHGLIGMRERTALYGGDFEARERAGGGFVVRARLPVEGEA
jgi:signal transduction histidine kinase